MTKNRFKGLALAIVTAGAMVNMQGCDSGAPASGNSASAVAGAVMNAISIAGNGMSPSRRGRALRSLSAADCDTHGQPNGGNNTPSDPDYPGMMTYCKLTVNDGSPETVQGPFNFVKNMLCSMENAGLVYDGVAHDMSVTLDTSCWDAAQLVNMGMPGGGVATVTITGSQPATFNSYFDSGIHFTYSVGTQTGEYFLGTKVTATKVEFAAFENGGATRTTAYAGSLDFSTGKLGVESRMERLDCPTLSDCGWNRHVRLFANMQVSGTEVTGVNDLTFGYSNIQSPPGQLGFGGVLVTAKGDLTNGIKPRVWEASDGAGHGPAAATDYDNDANWNEDVTPACYTDSSDTALTCGVGIDISPSMGFVLHGAHTSPSDFFYGYAGFTVSAVDLSDDVP